MARSRFLLILDTILFLATIVLLAPFIGGLAVHEWLGLAVLPPIVLHLLLAWPWIGALPRRLKARGAWRLRINVLLNIALFVTFVGATFSGFMTSLVVLPAVGIPPGNFQGWARQHVEWQAYMEIAVILHIAMNWNWIVGAIRRHVLARPTAKGEASIAALDADGP